MNAVAVGKRLVSLIHWAEIETNEARGFQNVRYFPFPR